MFKRFFQRQPRPPAPVTPFSPLTASDWHRSPSNTAYARSLQADPRFREMLAILSNARPSAHLLNASPTEAAIALGRRIGYDELFSLLLSLSHPPAPDVPSIEADYGAGEFDLSKTL